VKNSHLASLENPEKRQLLKNPTSDTKEIKQTRRQTILCTQNNQQYSQCSFGKFALSEVS
jgi:hypothetical protein